MIMQPDDDNSSDFEIGQSRSSPRVHELERIEALTTRDSIVFERITSLASSIFSVSNVGIHLLDDERQWVKAFHGMMDTRCTVEDAVCRIPVMTGKVVVLPDAQVDTRFDENPVVWNEDWPIRFYAGAPLTTSMGVHIGAFCLIDSRPRGEGLSGPEVLVLRQFADLVSATMELRQEQRTSSELLVRALEEDEVTSWLSERGLLRAFYRSGAEQVTSNPVAVVDAGIEQYERLRSAYGVNARNRILQEFAARLQVAVDSRPGIAPESDTASTDIQDGEAGRRDEPVLRAHYGDGHFVIAKIFDPGTSDSDIRLWARRLSEGVVEQLEEPFLEEGVELRITGRVGVSIDSLGVMMPHEVLDEAHHSSDGTPVPGISRIVWDKQGTRKRQRSTFSLDHQIRQGIRNDEFYLAYQPIIQLGETDHVIGAEALLRWKQVSGAEVGPAVFIPAAEELGLIGQLDQVAFELAAETLSRWKTMAPDLWISVNVSPQQFTGQGFSGLKLEEAIVAGLEPERTKIEVTESAIAGGGQELEQELQRLKEMGFSLALDDFGTGHSSLSRLIRLPFDILKVDRAFVADCPHGPGAAIVSSLSELASKLGMMAVGEGVETPEQEAYLRAHGYGLAQGYMYARPLSESRLLEFLEEPVRS